MQGEGLLLRSYGKEARIPGCRQFWNADDVRPIQDRSDGFVCPLQTQTAHREVTGSCRDTAHGEHCNASAHSSQVLLLLWFYFWLRQWPRIFHLD